MVRPSLGQPRLSANLTKMGFLVPSPEEAVCGYLNEINRINPNLTLAVVHIKHKKGPLTFLGKGAFTRS